MSRRPPRWSGRRRDGRPVNLDEGSFHTLVGYPVVKLDDAFVVHGPKMHKATIKPPAHRHEVRLPHSVYKAIEGCFWADDGIHFTFECQDLPARFAMSTKQLGDLVALLEKRAREIDVDYLSMDNLPMYRTLRQMRKTTDRLRSEYEWWKKEE